MLIVTKLVRVVIYCQEFPPIESYSLVLWFCTLNTFYVHLQDLQAPNFKIYRHQTRQGCDLPGEASTYKVIHVTFVTLQTDKTIFPLSQDFWSLKLTRCWLQWWVSEQKYLNFLFTSCFNWNNTNRGCS